MAKFTKPNSNSNSTQPKISVIIPMYNSEKYIGQCLESILNQTLNDYEVIVVDDCSTDNSISIIESFKNKFGNRLQIVKRDKNYESPGISRNIGIGLARGKYLFFLDSDDIILKTAFAELYDIAEKTNADVLHEEKFLITKDGSEEVNNKTQLIPITWERKDESGFVNNPTLISDKLSERLVQYSKGMFYWNTWSKFYRRDFIIKNNILFPDLISAEDMIFCFKCLCLAKNYVRIPNIVYFYRIRQGSIAHHNRQLENHMHRQIKIIIDGVRYLKDFMKDFDLLEQNSELRQNVLDIFIREHFNHLRNIYAETPIHEINKVVLKEFQNVSSIDPELVSYFFNMANFFRTLYIQSQQQISSLQEQLKSKS